MLLMTARIMKADIDAIAAKAHFVRVADFHDDERAAQADERQLRKSCTAALGQAYNGS